MGLVLLCHIMHILVIPAGKRVDCMDAGGRATHGAVAESSAMDGKLESIHGVWIHFVVYGSGTNPSGTDLHLPEGRQAG